MRYLPIVLMLLAFFTETYSQPQSYPSQLDSLIARRWDVDALCEKYPTAGSKLVDMIKRCYPDEIDSLLAKGDAERNRQEWGKAKYWYDIVLRAEPDNLSAHYGRGICQRETGRNTFLLPRYLAWRSAEEHFNRVFAVDSTFRDVFYQVALLEHYRQHRQKAINLAHRQLAVNPAAVDAQVGIFPLYDTMIHYTAFDKAEAWLKARPSRYDAYFLGELYRNAGLSEEADSVFQEVLYQPEDVPLQPVLLSRVRLYVENDEPEKAEEAYWKAVDRISDERQAWFVIKDFMTIVNESEYELLKVRLPPAQMPSALRHFWLRRDPMPAAPYNMRLIEHYRRLVFAEKAYYYGGFRHAKYKDRASMEFRFPPWYYENDKLNDQGLIYVRYGEPDETAFAMSRDGGGGLPQNMSWLYYENEERDRMIFHFIVHPNAPPGYWTLVPMFSQSEIRETMVGWDNRPWYDYVANRTADIDFAFIHDQHTWPEETETLEMSHDITRFREDDDTDLIQFSYAIPLSNLWNEESSKDSHFVETGIAIFDDRMGFLLGDMRRFTPNEPSGSLLWNDFLIDEYEFPLQLRRHNIAMHARTLDGTKVNGWQYRYTLTDSARHELACSTLKLAFDIQPKAGKDSRHRDDIRIIPNPTKIFMKDEPVFVYYEIYNLSFNPEGRTDFTVNFTLKESGKKKLLKKITGIFGSGAAYRVAIQSDQQSEHRTDSDYIVFDMSAAKEGRYELILEVKDNVNGDGAVSASDLWLK